LAWNLEIQVDKQFSDQVEEGWLRHVVEHALMVENIDFPAELSLLVTDDETCASLIEPTRNRLRRRRAGLRLSG